MRFLEQSEKKQILRRLNQNLRAQSPVEESAAPPSGEPSVAAPQNKSDTETQLPSNGDWKKWEAAEQPVLPVIQQTLEQTCAASSGNWSPHRTKPQSRLSMKWNVYCVLQVVQLAVKTDY